MAPRFPPPGCWSCGALPGPEELRLGAVLETRSAAEGGPWTRLRCPSCRTQTVVEEFPGREPVLAPPQAAGLDVPVLAALLDGALEARRRSLRWMERWGPGLEAMRRERPRRRRAAAEAPPPPPPPRREGAGRRKTPPPRGGDPPPAPPPREVPDLPRTAAEARAILGVPAGADRRAVDAAFRRASRKCHPDLVAHLDEDFQRLAHGKFLRLKAAHDLLRGSA